MATRLERLEDLGWGRQQLVTGVTAVVGTVVLAVMLRLEPGSTRFYVATLVLASVYAGGALLAGRLHLGRAGGGGGPDVPRGPRLVVGPLVLGLLLVVVFVLGGLVVREIGPIDRAVRDVLGYTTNGAGLLLVVTVVTGLAEEAFFRGALYDAVTSARGSLGRLGEAWGPVVVTTVVYGIATLATGNYMLGFAAFVLGAVVGLQRRATGGILAPMITHITWSVSMLFLLPLIFDVR